MQKFRPFKDSFGVFFFVYWTQSIEPNYTEKRISKLWALLIVAYYDFTINIWNKTTEKMGKNERKSNQNTLSNLMKQRKALTVQLHALIMLISL